MIKTLNSENILLLTGNDVDSLLYGREQDIIATVKATYQTHERGCTMMPPNAYLRFPHMEKERIIAKPAYLGGNFEVAGIKWIASFPGNLEKGLERASAVLVLNSIETGHVLAILESSIISAKRTAASAALAAQCLWGKDTLPVLGLVGCGAINFEILRYILAIYPKLDKLIIHDLNSDRGQQFKAICSSLNHDLDISIVPTTTHVIAQSSIISMATTAVTPYITSLDKHLNDDKVILNISLRDLSTECILEADNIVDDVDQVCSNNTSLHLAKQKVNHHNFIRCTIGEILLGKSQGKDVRKNLRIFSPFGLGILDMAVAKLAFTLAQEHGKGLTIPSFLPDHWSKGRSKESFNHNERLNSPDIGKSVL